MSKWLRRLVVLLLFLVPAYYLLVLHSPEPDEANRFVLDMEAIRAAASSIPGEKAMGIGVEKVSELQFAEAMVMAGEPWQWTPIPVYSFQLKFPAQTILVDTAFASPEAMPGFIVKSFDEAALGRVNAAMLKASQIVITHEHFDHIGGLLAHPQLEALLSVVRLTPEQLKHEDRMQPLSLPEKVFDDYAPLEYEDLLAIAPGVVLIKAPGHTPGSQMVFVQMANGEEVLLLGDVSWQQRNLDAVKERPLFITAIVKEDRTQVINQFQALHELAAAEPGIHIVPGHDQDVMTSLLQGGILHTGF